VRGSSNDRHLMAEKPSAGIPPTSPLSHNRAAWDRRVEEKNPWTIPVSPEQIAAARRGQLDWVLTPTKPVPRDWLPPLAGLPVLCLASGGGQQGPLLAAAGANVTVLDNSPRQLSQDLLVARRENLSLAVVQGDAADLSCFADRSFGLIVHPCSNCYFPEIRPVWNECYRVLRGGGVLLAGFTNPLRYLFEDELTGNGKLEVRYSIPYSDLDEHVDAHRRSLIAAGEALEFGHTLEDQIGGQIAAGFTITGFYEDRDAEVERDPISRYIDTFIFTRAVKAAELD
jgi:SAM-dependent methyltransferase